MKRFLKWLIRYSPVALTKNQHYDRLTKKVIKEVCRPASNCIDVGCHKGEILDLMIAAAPEGRHWGFEPIPGFYEALVKKYKDTHCTISNLALSDRAGMASFNYVTTNPSYSGLLRREYDRPNEQDTSIMVTTELLDAVLPAGMPVDLIKIDVEGAEMLVLKGARSTIARTNCAVIFEHGIGASDVYGTGPDEIFSFFHSLGYKIFLLENFVAGKAALSAEAFAKQYWQKKNFYFVATASR